jgi:hypothetical protein
MKQEKIKWDVEITDTYGGEANYCWVDRYTVEAVSELGAIQIVSEREGYAWRKEWDAGDCTRYNAVYACVCCFISWHDESI